MRAYFSMHIISFLCNLFAERPCGEREELAKPGT